jgi:hypothetical protein
LFCYVNLISSFIFLFVLFLLFYSHSKRYLATVSTELLLRLRILFKAWSKFPQCRTNPLFSDMNVFSTSDYVSGCVLSVFQVFLGVQAGTTLSFYPDWKGRVSRWIAWGTGTGLLAGILCLCSKEDGWIPVNKNLWYGFWKNYVTPRMGHRFVARPHSTRNKNAGYLQTQHSNRSNQRALKNCFSPYNSFGASEKGNTGKTRHTGRIIQSVQNAGWFDVQGASESVWLM